MQSPPVIDAIVFENPDLRNILLLLGPHPSERVSCPAMPQYSLNVNGAARSVDAWDGDMPVLYALRNDLGLHGAKFGCGLGQCGACTVLIDGRATRSCTVKLSEVAGKKIVTAEGLGTPAQPHPVQAAFIAEQAAQCGYCTNGMVMGAVALLQSNPRPTREQAQAALAGNLCRCGSHDRVLKAIARASKQGSA
jgi:nicotinate dehydrogenase subunit A